MYMGACCRWTPRCLSCNNAHLIAVVGIILFASVLGHVIPVDGSGESPTYVDSVRFVQYLDENTALEEVRGGNLDMYYYRISSDRLETAESRQGLDVHASTGGSYSILANPAVSDDAFNPLYDRDVRFALNYLIDRRLVVNELMGGYGMPIISHYGPSDPEYLTVIEDLARFDFGYNPTLAERIISERLEAMGAVRQSGSSSDENNADGSNQGTWMMDSEPVTLTFFIRSDDPVRKSIGEIMASELERMGFEIKREFGDLNKAFVVVYGSNPADLQWHLYTEGWAKSAFVRYDSTGLAQMYSPWFSNMPGFNDPSYWNYENERLDNLTQRIYTGDFADADERNALIRDALTEGILESVRIFLASKTDQYVTHESVDGVVNDFGAGLPSRFTPINARLNSDNDDSGDSGGEMRIGVKQIYQGSWNPVMGFRDAYSSQIGSLLSDPATFKHPYTGTTMPVRATWNVTTAGPDRTLAVAPDALVWNYTTQQWDTVGDGINATSVVVFEYDLGGWHSGVPMDMLDIMHSFYFGWEWGTQSDSDDGGGSGSGGGDITSDTEYTSVAAPSVETIRGVKPVGPDTIMVYVDYWHFDHGEIAQWAAPSVSMPWEFIAAMEGIVSDGRSSFSRSGAASKDVGWLSVIVPNDAALVRTYLESMRDTAHVPAALIPDGPAAAHVMADMQYYQLRYDSAISWIEKTGHAMVGNGPFYLDSYSPESRSIRIVSFDDSAYPFEQGTWSSFEHAALPSITGMDSDDLIKRGDAMHITVNTKDADSVLYFVSNGRGEVVASGTYNVTDSTGGDDNDNDSGRTVITIDAKDTRRLSEGANLIRTFALSDTVLRPDSYERGFLAVGQLAAGIDDMTATGPDDARHGDESGGHMGQAGSDASAPVEMADSDVQDDMSLYYVMLAVGMASIVFAIVMRKMRRARTQKGA